MNNLTKIICVSVMLSGSALAQGISGLSVGDTFIGKSGNKYEVKSVKQGTKLNKGDTVIFQGDNFLYKFLVDGKVPIDEK